MIYFLIKISILIISIDKYLSKELNNYIYSKNLSKTQIYSYDINIDYNDFSY